MVLSFCMTYQIMSPYLLLLDFELLVYKLHLWRLLTTFLFAGPFSMGFLFSMMMSYYTLRRLEELYQGKYPELVTMILFNSLAVMFFSWLYGSYQALQHPVIISLMYVVCKLLPDMQVSIWGFPVKSGNLPWVLVAFSVFTGGDPFKDLIGIAAGHTYYYLKNEEPLTYGHNFLKTPKIIEKLVNELIRRSNMQN
eukprot:CAMPEP_0202959088 /NCGR_PEP_ID=MMETSP1396-20130829/3365_1 /ASSEMBLY_ACC=CAM_ASM_000872 /TAXON_ID= /ORGANISM="Pseudokeronopsis sp., Strain Brazil" /LENGTH=194 /DNA_ID=CAMNT_0049677511 /DNA_START=54 /DNA_END=638 /DNA_ORIENTATION=+